MQHCCGWNVKMCLCTCFFFGITAKCCFGCQVDEDFLQQFPNQLKLFTLSLSVLSLVSLSFLLLRARTPELYRWCEDTSLSTSRSKDNTERGDWQRGSHSARFKETGWCYSRSQDQGPSFVGDEFCRVKNQGSAVGTCQNQQLPACISGWKVSGFFQR